MASWPYCTSAWKRLREARLQADPMCEPCRRIGRLVPANTVDHVVAIAKGGDAFPPPAGLMSMCRSCHNAKTVAVDRAGGSGVGIRGCGLDGFPVDPAHPFLAGDTPSKDQPLGGVDRWGSRLRTKFRGGR